MRLAEVRRVRFDIRKHVGGLQRLRDCVLTTAKRVAGLQSFGEGVSTA